MRAAGVRLLRLAMIHPLIPAEIAEFADGLDEIIVVEEKRGFVESAVRQILYGTPSAPRVTGKTTPEGTALFAADGVLDADSIAAGLARRLAARPGFAPVAAWQAARPHRARQHSARQRCCRSSPARRTSAPAARTTPRPRFPRARSSAPASAAIRSC